MGAVLEGVDMGADLGQLGVHPGVQGDHVGLGVVAARHARLVGGHEGVKPRVVHCLHRLSRADPPTRTPRAMHIAVVEVQHPVAVEDHRAAQGLGGRCFMWGVRGRHIAPIACSRGDVIAPKGCRGCLTCGYATYNPVKTRPRPAQDGLALTAGVSSWRASPFVSFWITRPSTITACPRSTSTIWSRASPSWRARTSSTRR